MTTPPPEGINMLLVRVDERLLTSVTAADLFGPHETHGDCLLLL
jgi:hypothetical protein